jgi:hypothetical protein
LFSADGKVRASAGWTLAMPALAGAWLAPKIPGSTHANLEKAVIFPALATACAASINPVFTMLLKWSAGRTADRA